MNRMTTTTIAIVATFCAVSSVHAAGDVPAGKAKAAACAACHRASGQGVAPNPALAGKPEAQLIQAMKDYKSGKRDNAVMKGMAGALSDQDIENVAAYYASLK